MTAPTPDCAACPHDAANRLCVAEGGSAPAFCPTRDLPELVERSLETCRSDPDTLEFARQAAVQEAEGYADRGAAGRTARPCKTRIEEIMAFAGKMDYRRLGMAFCIGLRREARAVRRIFAAGGFEVVSAACKAGRIPKERIGLGRDQQIDPTGPEAMCNPLLQAMILNRAGTQFNVLLGLCVGHDSLFLRHAEAPCTVLAVKDRVLGHNPLAAVYQLDGYYRHLRQARTAEPKDDGRRVRAPSNGSQRSDTP